jgi:aldehyde:ferredoxin oxidoreductase
MCDTLGICKFASKWGSSAIGYEEMAELLTCTTGIDFDAEGIRKTAERINNLERAYLVREGVTRKDDAIHGRIMDEPVPSGTHKGKMLNREKFNAMLDDYYDIVGWNKKTGIPEKSTLLGLGLQDVAAELEKMGKYS